MNNSTAASPKRKRLCIIGLGTYGAYLLDGLLSLSNAQDYDITAIEIGDTTTKSETEIGIKSISPNSNAPSAGRYFGLGGTSARWGGQILFFDERDNPAKDKKWSKIIDLNEKHRKTVVKKLIGSDRSDIFQEDKEQTKVGIWLKYTNRNLYKKFKLGSKATHNSQLITHNSKNTEGGQKVEILSNLRVIGFNFNENQLKSVLCRNANGQTQTIEADVFYLTAGCIESCRLLLQMNREFNNLNSDLLGKNFGDHLSVPLCKIKNHAPQIGNTQFAPFFYKGNMVTKRWVAVSENERVGFVHPIFNTEVKVFTSLKQMLFGKQKFDFKLKDLLTGLVFLVKFGFSFLFFKKLYADPSAWILRLDIEQGFPNNNQLTLDNSRDNYGQSVIKIDYAVDNSDRQAIADIQTQVFKTLTINQLDFEPIYDPSVLTEKIEDVFHPVGTMPLGNAQDGVVGFDFAVHGVPNLFHFSTALFPSAKSINPTAAAFCFIEEHLESIAKQDFINFSEKEAVLLRG